jgi:hypothetical protein
MYGCDNEVTKNPLTQISRDAMPQSLFMTNAAEKNYDLP